MEKRYFMNFRFWAYFLLLTNKRILLYFVMPLVFLLLSSALNVVLDLWFIAGMGMGVAGAAVATVIAQGVSVVLCILYVMARVRASSSRAGSIWTWAASCTGTCSARASPWA